MNEFKPGDRVLVPAAPPTGAQRRPRGRPPQDPATVRSDVLRIRVSADERAALEAAASGQDVSTWLRELGLAEARRG